MDPAGADEFEAAGLAKAECRTIRAPRVAASPAALECRLWKLVDLPGEGNVMVLGEVTGIHLDESFVTGGIFDVTAWQPLARLGYRDYTIVRDRFALNRPDER
jgi:flavin reductase (DIM6/NTAB) family NADH-FMN oxidoreductase RutF